MKHVKAREIMSTPVIAVRTTDALPDVVRTLRRHAISGVPVLDMFGLMVGIVSEGDILERAAGPAAVEPARPPHALIAVGAPQ